MKKWIIGLFLVGLMVMVFTGFVLYQANIPAAGSGGQISSNPIPQNGEVAGSLSYQIDLKTTMPAYPEKILVYKTNPPIVTRDAIYTLAKKFNVTGKLREGENAISIQSEDFVFGVELGKKSGSATYLNQKRPNDATDAPDKLPSDEEAIKIATDFLERNDLLPDGAYLGGARRGYAVYVGKDRNNTPRYGEVTVWFDRKLNNLEVEGTQLSLEIGGNGDIIRYYANWRDYTPYKEYSIKSPETAFEDLKKQGITVGAVKPDTVTIDNVYLAYATKAGAFKEEYLEPVWVFKGKKTYSSSDTKPVTEWIPALSEAPAELISSTPTPKIETTSNITSTPTSLTTTNIAATQTTAAITANETATPAVTTSPISNTPSTVEETQTIMLPVTTVTITNGTTAAINVTNSS